MLFNDPTFTVQRIISDTERQLDNYYDTAVLIIRSSGNWRSVFRRRKQMFRRNLTSPLRSENIKSKSLQIFCTQLPNHTASYPRR